MQFNLAKEKARNSPPGEKERLTRKIDGIISFLRSCDREVDIPEDLLI